MRVSVNFGAPLVQHIATLPLGAGVTGLDIARATDHPRGSDFTVCLLRDMAIQAVQLGRPDEARAWRTSATPPRRGPHPVSAATTSCLATIQAGAYATQSDATGCDRALRQAVETIWTRRSDHHGAVIVGRTGGGLDRRRSAG